MYSGMFADWILLGIMTSFLGIGGGPINLVVLYYFFSMETKIAASNSLYIILFSQITSLLTTLVTKTVPEFSFVTLAVMVAGGILGGISRGDDIIFRVAVKPVPSIYLSQETVDVNGNECDILIEGRHDVCLCPRIVPVVEAMTAITLADMVLRNRSSRV